MIPQPDEIVYDRRRKRLMIQVLPGGKVVLKAPMGTPKRQITGFLEQHAGWIAEKRALMSKVAEPAQAYRFAEGELIWLGGQQYPLHLTEKGVKGLVFRQGQGFSWRRASKRTGQKDSKPSIVKPRARQSQRLLRNMQKCGVYRLNRSASRGQKRAGDHAAGRIRLISRCGWRWCHRKRSSMWWCTNWRIPATMTIRRLFGPSWGRCCLAMKPNAAG